MSDTADAAARHIWRMLMTDPSSVHPEATSSDGNIPLGGLFFDMPVGGRIIDVHQQSSCWDTILLNNLGQQMAPLMLCFLVPRCRRLLISDSNTLALRARLQGHVVEISSRSRLLECQELLHSHVRWCMGEMDCSLFGIPWQGAWWRIFVDLRIKER